MSFKKILEKNRRLSFSEKDKGDRFERLIQAYLKTDPKYSYLFKTVWLWNEFIGKNDFGGKDIGIDLVAVTNEGDYWAIQCKCFQETTIIDKPSVDSFLSTSSKEFIGENGQTVKFSHRLWISTTNKWGSNATEAIRNQNPPVTRINLFDLYNAPVDWVKLDEGIYGEPSRTAKKQLMPHQKTALENAHKHFMSSDRGKLIMACGTGKTLTSLRIAENETNGQGLVLFLVPSISLLGQTLREWTGDAIEPINAICICSDSKVTRKKSKDDDSDNFTIVDLALPASTNVKSIIKQFSYINSAKKSGMTVVFSTYQSIQVIAETQKQLLHDGDKFGVFDLIVCDEAHRTTGIALAPEDASDFIKVHENDFIKAHKRLYMTATPRLYSDDAKGKAAKAEAILCSMDDRNLYGEEIYRIGFGEAVEHNLLTDYKVLILTLSDNDVPPAIQKSISDKSKEINADDAAKLIGCINALSKQVLGDGGNIQSTDPGFMRRAVAFCQNISISKKITTIFNTSADDYLNELPDEKKEQMVSVSSRHIDGTMTAPDRDELLGWLQSDNDDGDESNECRILTNVRCLSEGVDVPSLDAVMFLSARNSQVDVVQSVGRVMRKAPDKKYGYIIIPVLVPSNVEAHKALDDNERYKVVWTVLNALRAHDDRFNATVNKIELNKKRPVQILVGGTSVTFDEKGRPIDKQNNESTENIAIAKQLMLKFEELQNVIFARMVEKVGDRRYWEQWAKNVGEIAERQLERLNRLIDSNKMHEQAFDNFLISLQKNINPSISRQEAVEMLSQHIITKPVFEALFDEYSFVKNNPISVSMQTMLDLLEGQALEKDTETLNNFYQSVKMRASGIDNAEGRQRIIIELYDKFFKTAFPKMVERLGIVYTPVEVVDFIIHSVNDVLINEFNRSIGDENVHVLDPFTGTGTFITRLLQSGLIHKKDLQRKYLNEIHANEIILLAYYIAAINIENAYHELTGEEHYTSFEGICLTDTFQLGESDGDDHLFSEMFPKNSERVNKQKKEPVMVIVGNPPYSVGQRSANDNAQNQKYDKLERRIASTYAALTKAILKNSLYDSYIKAFRWSSDRLDPKNGGIIAFVSNGAWLDGNSQDGFRKCLEKEFSSIYVFNLRGNQRTSGELSRKEGGKIFGSGSRTPIAITLLVKNPNKVNEKAVIYYHDVGDYLNREEKLSIVRKFGSVVNSEMPLITITPNGHGDWISKRNSQFETFVPIGDKGDKKTNTFFVPFYSNGLKTQRDAWCYNSSRIKLSDHITNTITFYNQQVDAVKKYKELNQDIELSKVIDYNPLKISWTRALKWDLEKGKKCKFDSGIVVQSLYRPFFKQHLYYSRELNELVFQIPKLLPSINVENVLICVSGVGVTKEFSTIITDTLPDLELIGKSQCFPLYYYEERPQKQMGLFDKNTDSDDNYIRKDGVSDFILNRAKKQYGKNINKEDIFYYVYGLLHSPDYRETFSNDLKKMLPRIPLVDTPIEFWKFSKAGRELADLHIHYEKVPPCENVSITGAENEFFKVEKMRFPKKGQKDTIFYNSQITIENIPERAYEYVVNGKSAIEWIMERYQITKHKDSGIVNDPNDWAEETGNPRYILDLLLSVINLSLKTLEIVENLPKLDFSDL
jgi:predicted helicase